MSKPFSFHDMMAVDPTQGSWNDAIGLIAYQYKKRRRGLIGEAVKDKCEKCDCEQCVCDESFEAQFDALTPTAEETSLKESPFAFNREQALKNIAADLDAAYKKDKETTLRVNRLLGQLVEAAYKYFEITNIREKDLFKYNLLKAISNQVNKNVDKLDTFELAKAIHGKK
jgi:hypothetical protein